MDSPFRSHTRFDLSAELVALDATSPSSYQISPDETDLSCLSAAEQNVMLNTLIDRLALTRPEELPREQELWNNIRGFLKYFDAIEDAARSKVADGITSSFSQLVNAVRRDVRSLSGRLTNRDTMLDDSSDDDSYSPEDLRRMYCEPIEMWSFLVNWLLYIADKVANMLTSSSGGSGATGAATGKARAKGKKNAVGSTSHKGSSGATFPWTTQILPTLLSQVTAFLDIFPSNIFYPLSTPRDSLLSTLLRPTLSLIERESTTKAAGEVRNQISNITCIAVKRHGQAQTAQTMLLQLLQYYEHVPEIIAHILTQLKIEYDYSRLAEDILKEIANREFGSAGNATGTFAMSANQENKTPRVFSRFLVAFTETNPRTTLKSISLLSRLIESEAYPIRNGMIEVFYLLIRDLVLTDDQITPLMDPDSTSAGDDVHRESSEEARKRQIEGFWNLLLERYLDVNSYVRVKTIQICTRLCDLPAKFPSQRARLLTLTRRALKDKSSSVRKASINLLTRLVLTHPYGLMHGGELDEKVWSIRIGEIKLKMQDVGGGIELPEEDDTIQDDGADSDEGAGDADGQEQLDPQNDGQRSIGQIAQKSIDTTKLASQLSAQDLDTLNRLSLTHKYYSDALSFIGAFASSMSTLEELLFSSNKGEALEAMDFFRVAAEYKLPGAERGMRRMVHLVWTKDNNAVVEPSAGANPEDKDPGSTSTPRSIRSRLVEVYTSLYFTPLSHLTHTENVGLMARNLVERTQSATLAELTSLEELLSIMSTDGVFSSDVIERLWSVYATPPGRKSIERSQRRGAIIVLSMLAANTSRRHIVQEKMDVLLGIGLGPLGKNDPVLAKWTVVALGRIGGSTKKVKGALSDKRIRFPMTHPMFYKLRSAILSTDLAGETGKEETKGEWFSLAENCIQVIYDLGEQPDRLCGDIIRWFMVQIFGTKEQQTGNLETADNLLASSSPQRVHASSSHPALGSKASAFQLAQLLFVAGHVALKQIVYLENVEREYKRRKAEAEKKSNATDPGSGSKKGCRDRTKGPTDNLPLKDSGAANKGSVEKANDDGDELEQVAGNVEDEIGEIIGEIREKELLFGGRSLLALFGPMVAHVSSNPKSYGSDHLRKAAVLSLCKFMCVSSGFCETNLSLLLHILTTSSDPVTRSNVVIALGDIAVSFGTLIDENSDRLYAGLNDRDLGVKKHTLMVLTHLILNGMIKVKGQLGEMAKCLEDPEARVSDLAKLFFSELATKENAVYNNLPDIISHLSIGKHAVDEDTFERTMRFIFTFIDKEKQAENVVEKLCQRFRLTSADRQWRDIAFCLSLLHYKSDKSVKKLIEGLPFYQDKLHDEIVYTRFIEIVAKARSAKGSGGRGGGVAASHADAGLVGSGALGEAELADFESLLENFHTRGAEEARLERGSQAKMAKASRSHVIKAGVPGNRGGRGSRSKVADAKGGVKKFAKAKGGRHRRAVSSDEDEVEDSNEDLSAAGEGDDDDDHSKTTQNGQYSVESQQGRPAPTRALRTKASSVAPVRTKTARASRHAPHRVAKERQSVDSDSEGGTGEDESF